MSIIGIPVDTPSILIDEFKNLSGLIDITDATAILWLNRGIKFLDQQTDFQYSPARQAIVVSVDSWNTPFLSDCRSIRDVYLIDATDGRNPVEVLPHKRFYELYPNIPSADTGLPIACTPAITIASNIASAVGGAPTYDNFVESTLDGATYRSLIFNCKTDKEYQLEIFGKFYSIPLISGNEDNWWVLNFSETVLAAALYKLNLIMFRNSEGAKDYLVEIQETTKQLDFDGAEEAAEGIIRMEG